MSERSLSILRRLAGRRRLVTGLLAGLPLLGSGCMEGSPAALAFRPAPTVVRGVAPEELIEPARRPAITHGLLVRSAAQVAEPEKIPTMPAPAQAAFVRSVTTPRLVPISLDIVLRMSEGQNAAVGQAREKVEEAQAEVELAGKRWLPNIYLGTGYGRHEGGIQDETGEFLRSSFGNLFGGLELHTNFDPKEFAYQKVMAERQAWQSKGELSRITNETLLDAAGTYLDLLTARTGEAIAREHMHELRDLLAGAEKLAQTEKGAQIEVERIRAEIFGREQAILKLRAQAESASAKLVYLLGLDPAVQFVPVDTELVPVNLVDASRDTSELVAEALAGGPGIREIEGLVGLVEDALTRAKGPGRLMPAIEMRMLEGGFGAGEGDQLTWDNRWDLCFQVRWNLTDLYTSKDRCRKAEAQRSQVHMAYLDLKGKLTAGVMDARETILSGQGQIETSRKQIEHAERVRTLSRDRLDNNIQGSSRTEVLLSMQAKAGAQINYLSALREFDKAQIRLMLLLGQNRVGDGCPH